LTLGLLNLNPSFKPSFSKSLVYIDGTVLDFEKEGLNEGFKFNNPNVKAECGCGESFTV
jgi:iron-sulfur cluster assembly protein